MTTNLFRALYLGQDLPDENLRDIPYPRFEVHWHVMYKCVEVGGLLGMCFFGPIAGALRGKSMAGVIKSANSVRQISITQDYEPLLSIRRRIIKKMLMYHSCAPVSKMVLHSLSHGAFGLALVALKNT